MRWLKLLAASLLLISCSRSDSDSPLMFQDAWVRAMPPGSMMTAGFGRLLNAGDTDIEISAYTSPGFFDVSLHQTVLENGISRMKSVPELTLRAGTGIKLEPGGYHLMFMKPTADVLDVVVLHIDLSSGQRFSFELPVERR